MINYLVLIFLVLSVSIAQAESRFPIVGGKYERHLQIPAAAVTLGASGPTYQTVNTAVRCLEFDEGEDAFTQIEIPDDSIDNQDFILEVDWFANVEGLGVGETVVWTFDWLSRAEGEDIDTGAVSSGTTTYTDVGGATIQGLIIHSKLVLDFDDATNPLTKQDHIYIRFEHDASSTFNGKVCMTALELLYNSKTFPQI